MKHTEQEMILLKEEVNRMWQLVLSQLEKARQAFLTNDTDLAREVISREKRVDVCELKIESDCENYIALYSPVAIDLRLTLSLMKICSTLERIGDFAAGIAMHVLDEDCQDIPASLIEKLDMEQMFTVLQGMLSDCYVALESENTQIAGRIFSRDKEVNAIYHAAPKVLAQFLTEHPEHIYCGLKLLLLIRKLERIGDHCGNIVEEIVFYVDAKVLKHNKSKAD
ncbi:PhoU family transcriptional regulator [Porphyromonas sp. COT-052 OH4946]|uniref:phosphate signaling complex protein PhoU n=1 Tax=Porphyromonas sp. COT-052 OH4946 TaxID=1515618 RepID=UPI00051CD8F5|nr:phosphate signaling complex protein PhoU [Porphyromonas sp. COT-052 OH4946]KGL56864.1 PhoU family transcriptional regulator [Porphyromonas sp. COT-052 OH4946]